MYTKCIIYPYNLGSQSARRLAEGLNTIRVRPNGSYYHRAQHLVINWGNSTLPRWATPRAIQHMLNTPQNVEIASNKISTFQRLGENIPEWTTDIRTARNWLATPIFGRKLNAVVCRTLTRANSGRGIVLAKTPEEVVAAPLYTRYTPKTLEYRAHVSVRQGVIDIAEKRRRNGFENNEQANQYIRSWDNGWVFCREDLNVPDAVRTVAEGAIHRLGLHFGAVDVGYHPDFGAVVYEVNTAPGLEGQTLINYINMFRSYLGN